MLRITLRLSVNDRGLWMEQGVDGGTGLRGASFCQGESQKRGVGA